VKRRGLKESVGGEEGGDQRIRTVERGTVVSSSAAQVEDEVPLGRRLQRFEEEKKATTQNAPRRVPNSLISGKGGLYFQEREMGDRGATVSHGEVNDAFRA